MPGRIVISQGDEGIVRFNLLDEDGTVLASSKAFESPDAARDAAARALRLAADAEVIDQTAGGSPVRASPSVADPRD